MIKKYCRYSTASGESWGLVEDDKIARIAGDLFGEHQITSEKIRLTEAKLLAPVTPTKIVCVGLNYREHVKESQSATEAPKEPVLFMKPLTAIIGPNDEIVGPPASERVDYEAEIGVVIKSRCKNIAPSDVGAQIFGVTCVNDVTARDLQKKDVQWTRGKGFDSFCPVGPFLVSGLDYLHLGVQSRLNGEIRQRGNSSDMIFPINDLVSFISGVMTLLPGDLIVTGTPQGVGPMSNGDVIEVEIEEIGVLKNTFVQHTSGSR